MAKLADASDSRSDAERHGGSTPSTPTKFFIGFHQNNRDGGTYSTSWDVIKADCKDYTVGIIVEADDLIAIIHKCPKASIEDRPWLRYQYLDNGILICKSCTYPPPENVLITANLMNKKIFGD